MTGYILENPVKCPLIFDTHAHYTDEKFENIRDELLSDIHKNYGVKYILNCGDTIESSKKSLALSKKYPFIFSAVGIHPESVKEKDIDILALKKLSAEENVVAIGEIGLDYYWDKTYIEEQKSAFERQIILANELSLPVIVHDREAHFDTLSLLQKHSPKGVVHCFSGSKEMAEEIIKLGMYIGVGGAVTFKNPKKLISVVSAVPLERILLETDAPYMTPEPNRSKINNSALICYVAEKIAEIKNVSAETVLKTTLKNGCDLFNIQK